MRQVGRGKELRDTVLNCGGDLCTPSVDDNSHRILADSGWIEDDGRIELKLVNLGQLDDA